MMVSHSQICTFMKKLVVLGSADTCLNCSEQVESEVNHRRRICDCSHGNHVHASTRLASNVLQGDSTRDFEQRAALLATLANLGGSYAGHDFFWAHIV